MKVFLFVLLLAALFLLAHQYTSPDRVAEVMDHITAPRVVPTE